MAGATVKLMTNIPITGTILYCDYMPTKNPQYSDQIALKGEWDGNGAGRIYLHVSVEKDLQDLGIIGARASNGNYQLLRGQVRVKICKVEQGGSKKTVVELLDGAPPFVAPTGATPTQPTLYPPAQQSSCPAPALALDTTDLVKTLEDSLAISLEIWKRAGGSVEKNIAEIASTAHTLFIERCKRNLFGKTEAVPF